MDRLEAMRTFVAVAELGSFSGAARQLRCSPPTVTRLIAGLETHLQVQLFQRTTRKVVLSSEGELYLDRVRHILADVDDAEHVVKSESLRPSGRFVVTAPLVFGRKEVAPLMSTFLATYPDVRGELTLADRVVDLLDEGVDAAIRIGHLRDSTMRVRPVGATRRVAIASPSYLETHKRIRVPSDLAHHSTIHVSPLLTSMTEWRFRQGKTVQRIDVRPSFVTNSADAAVTFAEHGGGVAIVLSYQVAEQVADGRLKIVLARFEPPPLPIQVVYPGGRLPSATVRAFIDYSVAHTEWGFLDLRSRRGAAQSS